MSTFYTNITVHGPSQAQIKAYMKAAGRKAYVSPSVNGFTVIYDSRCDEEMDPRLTGELAADLSRAFSCNALAVINRHDYVLIYQLYQDGRIVDEYFSEHDLFGFDTITSYHVSGDVKAVCSAFDRCEMADRLEAILSEDYDSEHMRHRDLVSTLGLPAFSVSLGYTAISEGELPGDVGVHEIEHTQGGDRPGSAGYPR